MTFSRLLTTLFLLSALSPASAQNASTEGRREPVLTVVGKGTYETKPDLAKLEVTVSTEGKTLAEATKVHEERATRAQALLENLAKSGVEVERSSFKLNERRIRPTLSQAELLEGKRTITIIDGYTAQSTFSLKLSRLENMNLVVSKIAEAGLFEIGAARFEVAQDRAALNQARRAAMFDAKEQALAYAEPVGLDLAQIILIADGEARPPDGMANLPSRPTTGAYTVQLIPPATIEYTASVNVTWRIEARR